MEQKDMQEVLNAIHKEELAREKQKVDAKVAEEKAYAAIEAEKEKAYAETVKSIMESISPDLVAALTAKSNNEMLETVTASMSPYAMARGESVAEVTNKLLRGTSLEGILETMANKED